MCVVQLVSEWVGGVTLQYASQEKNQMPSNDKKRKGTTRSKVSNQYEAESFFQPSVVPQLV